ncbi:MAG TPA: hypothetical protein VLS51_02380, partial [Propionibacteriaceae bacterium]|nr:hypothetical protein [Propionibacteriaceae bacterium]
AGTSPGQVSLYQSGPGSANVIADVAGYFLGGSGPYQPGMYVPVTPARVLDTRSGSPLAGLTPLNLPKANLANGGVPTTGVSAVVVNATVTDTHTAGYLTVYPGLSSLPTASNLNWSGANATTANLVTAQVGGDGSLNIFNGSPGSVSVIADTAGYYVSY